MSAGRFCILVRRMLKSKFGGTFLTQNFASVSSGFFSEGADGNCLSETSIPDWFNDSEALLSIFSLSSPSITTAFEILPDEPAVSLVLNLANGKMTSEISFSTLIVQVCFR